MSTGGALTVLVIDDSAVMRQLMVQLAERRHDLIVVTAADPVIAERKLENLRPDVVLLDLEMPRMSGLEFLRRQMRRDPLPVVVCSSHATAGSDRAMEALAGGAVDLLPKPRFAVREHFEEHAAEIVETLRTAATARLERRIPALPAPLPRQELPACSGGDAIVGIGASTGGPQALEQVLGGLPAGFPPVVVVQHMPRPFTAAFARRLDSHSALDVREAVDGEILQPGMARIAPGDRHLLVDRRRGAYRTRLDGGDPVGRHRPSVDVLFHSLALSAGARAAAVLLTGMGQDGAEGLLALRLAGARTLAQDEASSVVFGMPRAAIHLGAADETPALADVAERLLCWAGKNALLPLP
ncbi:MAG TPA: chemotaxis response regulator protein-glutamate methylesterase [Acidobacteria bacterium]|nr:chemotaxis response regulator protein-glutamate methylesterase [Acidobacteriota bacterium]